MISPLPGGPGMHAGAVGAPLGRPLALLKMLSDEPVEDRAHKHVRAHPSYESSPRANMACIRHLRLPGTFWRENDPFVNMLNGALQPSVANFPRRIQPDLFDRLDRTVAPPRLELHHLASVDVADLLSRARHHLEHEVTGCIDFDCLPLQRDRSHASRGRRRRRFRVVGLRTIRVPGSHRT